jgi:methyltransferase, FkbM family
MKLRDIITETELPDGTRVKFRPFCPGEAGVIVDIFEHELYASLDLKEGEIVFDVGAHIGAFTIKAAKIVGETGNVLSFEPHPGNFAMLKENIEMNNCSNVIPFQTALSFQKGDYDLNITSISIAHSLVFERGWEKIQVNCSTIDDIVEESKSNGLKGSRVDVIKIDAVGAEIPVLQGGADTIATFRPRIAVAAYHTPAQVYEVMDFLKTIGYKAKQVSERGSIYRTGENFVAIVYGYPASRKRR